MLKVRLQRTGKRNDPSFRLVVTESQNGPQSGKFLEVLGNLDIKKGNAELNAERVKHWIANGAQVSDTVHNLLVSEKIIEGKKINVLPKKSPIKKEEPEEEKKEEAPVAESTENAETPEAPVEEAAPAEEPQAETPEEEKTT